MSYFLLVNNVEKPSQEIVRAQPVEKVTLRDGVATLAIAVIVATMGSAAPAGICVASSMLSGILGDIL